MDNILKLLLGVLAVSGFIAILVPSESPVAPPIVTPQSSAALTPAPAEFVDEEEVEENPNTEDEIDDKELDGDYSDEDDFQIGEPSIDGRPFGSEYNVPSDRPNAVVNTVDNTQQQPEIMPVPVTNSENVVL